ncbi:MAG: ATP-binding protein [Solirubrobacterales bacterium]
MAAVGVSLGQGTDSLNLTLDPEPENAAIARHAVGDLAARLGIGDAVRTSAEVVVTEAFTNATRHAYVNGSPAPIEVSASADADQLEISVRDHGTGFRPRPVKPGGGGRMGLLLMAAVADSVRFLHLRGGGTEVCAAVTPESAWRGLREPAECPGC